MAQNLKQVKKLGLALAVTAVTGGLTTGVWAVNNVAGTGNGVALGTDSAATRVADRTSIAIGDAAAAAYRDSIAIGNGADSDGNGAIAFGLNTKTVGMNAIAIGTNATTVQENNVAIGTGAEASGAEDVAIGRGAKANGYSVVLGSGSVAKEEKSVAIGKNVKVENPQGIAIGSDITASGKSSIAIGDQANTTAAGLVSVAMGPLAQATVTGGVALGWESLADRASGTAGYDPLTGTASKLTNATWKGTSGAISVGDGTNGLTRQIINVAAGTQDTDAVNVAQLKKVETLARDTSNVNLKFSGNVGTGTVNLATQNFSITGDGNITTTAAANGMIVGLSKEVKAKIDSITPVKYMSINSTKTDAELTSQDKAAGKVSNVNNNGAMGEDSIAIGPNVAATDTGAVAIGKGTLAGKWSVALGNESNALEGSSVAIGYKAKVEKGPRYKDGVLDPTLPNNASNGVAIGSAAQAIGLGATALGYDARAKVEGAAALGYASYATKVDSLSLGRKANAMHDSGVALGSYAKTDRLAGAKIGYDSLTNADSTDETATWKSTLGVVSIGDTASNKTRQIAGVAAGSLDTDAVNVAQLKAARVTLEKGSNISSIDVDTTGGFTKYTINAVDTIVKDGSASYVENGTGTITLNTESNGTAGTVTVSGLQDKYINGATLDGNKLTITRNDGETYEIKGIATTADVAGTSTSISKKLSQGFKIKGGSNDTEGSTIALNGDVAPEITFDVKEADKGLTVELEGNAIKYGIDADKLAKTLGVDAKNLGNASAWTLQANGEGGATIAKDSTVNFVGDGNVTATIDGSTITYGIDATKLAETLGVDAKNLGNASAWKLQANGEGDATIVKDSTVNFVGDGNVTATIDGSTITYGIDATKLAETLGVDAKNLGNASAWKLQANGEGDATIAKDSTVNFVGDGNVTATIDGSTITYGIDATKLAETLGVNSDNLNGTFAKSDASNLTPENVINWKEKLGVTSEQLSQAGAWTIQGGGADKATISGAKKVNFVGGSFTTVDVTATADGADVSIGLDETATKAIENVNKFIKTDESGNAKLNIVGDDETGVKVAAQDDGSTKVSLADHANIGQVAIDGKDGKGEITGLTNTTWTPDKPETIKADRAATEGQLQGLAEHIAGDISKINTAITNNGKELNTEKATIGGNTTIDKEGITVKNPNGEGSTKITGDTITTGTVNADEVNVSGITITKDGINANNQKITGVAPGVNGTDAVNMNQLTEVKQGVSNVGSAVNRLSNRVDKVAAGSAALAALHPLDFDSDDKLSFAVGFGGYKGEHAAALGAFYRANDDLMFSLGATVGNSNDQYNAGVSFRFGESSPYTNMSKADMAAKLETQDKNMAVLQADNEELKARLAKLEALVIAK